MIKKKILKKRESLLSDIPRVNFKHYEMLEKVSPSQFFKDHQKVALALLQALTENDTEAFLEILDTYLDVNRSKTARDTNLSRSTVQLTFSKQGNPTLKTIAKIVHAASSSDINLFLKK